MTRCLQALDLATCTLVRWDALGSLGVVFIRGAGVLTLHKMYDC